MKRFPVVLFKGLPLAVAVTGSILLIFYHFFLGQKSMPVKPGIFAEMINIPLDFLDLGVYKLKLETQNYLLFQVFESMPPQVFTNLTLVFGIAVWLLVSIGICLIVQFKRMYFILSMVLVIFLLTLTGVNGLNVGGISTNWAYIILLIGVVFPAAVIHTFLDHWPVLKKVAVILPIALLTMPLLVFLGDVPSGEILVSEHAGMLGSIIAAIFMLYIGHAFMSSVFVLLAKLNKGVGLKISWHLTIIFLVYLIFCILLLLRIMGSFVFIPMPPVFTLFLFVGILGYFETKMKIRQVEQPYPSRIVGEGLYLAGFAISILVFWKAEFSSNQPMLDFLNHAFIYGQIAFGLLFYAYLMANFTGIMDKGKEVEKVLFRPNFFAYYHLRLGGLMALLSVVVFADGIVAVQFNTASTNVAADYFYAVGKPREAGILFENSWERYRRNKKALNAAAHLELLQNRPSSATNMLVRGFENTPTVEDILLLSSLLNKRGEKEEALGILEQGLDYFPGNPYLLNNTALLYSQAKRGGEAYGLLDRIKGPVGISIANKIALQAKHLVHYDEDLNVGNNIIAQANQLALDNLKGIKTDFYLNTADIQDGTEVVNRAILRNQWSNQTIDAVEEDFAILDSLLTQGIVPRAQEELRETRVIRGYQAGYINETLKHINGLAFQFDKSAGFYHAMAAHVLIGELDFEKASIELVQAEAKGFRNFSPELLMILYFGNQVDKAFEISVQHKVPFPDWMSFDPADKLVPNDTVAFFTNLSTLYTAVKPAFIEGLNRIENADLKAFYAFQVLLRKGHWLDVDEIGDLIGWIEESEMVPGDGIVEELEALLTGSAAPSTHRYFFQDSLSPTRNAYWTPMVMAEVERTVDNLERYNIILEATDFNKDPLLWINLVKYSRIVGVDHYVSGILNEMNGWVDAETLVELQIQNL